MWVQKYLDNTEREWKYILEYFSKKRNLRLFLRSNFNADELPNYMPSYYMNAIKNWSRLSEPHKAIMAEFITAIMVRQGDKNWFQKCI